jgi:hypothetical protein
MKRGYFEMVRSDLDERVPAPTREQARRAARVLASVARGDLEGLRRALRALGLVR